MKLLNFFFKTSYLCSFYLIVIIIIFIFCIKLVMILCLTYYLKMEFFMFAGGRYNMSLFLQRKFVGVDFFKVFQEVYLRTADPRVSNIVIFSDAIGELKVEVRPLHFTLKHWSFFFPFSSINDEIKPHTFWNIALTMIHMHMSLAISLFISNIISRS